MPECIHEIEIATCGICRPRVSPDDPELPGTRRPQDGWGFWLTAKYDSVCAGCDGPIERGDQIRSNLAGGWLCASCGDAFGGPHLLRVTGDLL